MNNIFKWTKTLKMVKSDITCQPFCLINNKTIDQIEIRSKYDISGIYRENHTFVMTFLCK